MEWFDLLKILSDQQTNEITQQQIEALRDGVQQARLENFLMALCLLAMVAGLLVAVYFLNRACERQVRRLDSKLQQLDWDLGVHKGKFRELISSANSMNLEKSDVEG